MRLSSAMMLGSTMIELKPCNWQNCAIGVAARAVGMEFPESFTESHLDRILDEWPWLRTNCDERLCEILVLFDQRVCRGEMTFDELCAHVASIEPPCDCGVRDCVCDRISGMMDVCGPTAQSTSEVDHAPVFAGCQAARPVYIAAHSRKTVGVRLLPGMRAS